MGAPTPRWSRCAPKTTYSFLSTGSEPGSMPITFCDSTSDSLHVLRRAQANMQRKMRQRFALIRQRQQLGKGVAGGREELLGVRRVDRRAELLARACRKPPPVPSLDSSARASNAPTECPSLSDSRSPPRQSRRRCGSPSSAPSGMNNASANFPGYRTALRRCTPRSCPSNPSPRNRRTCIPESKVRSRKTPASASIFSAKPARTRQVGVFAQLQRRDLAIAHHRQAGMLFVNLRDFEFDRLQIAVDAGRLQPRALEFAR